MVNLEGRDISSNISMFDLYIRQENGNFSGTAWNNFYQFAFDFCGVREMVRILEELFNYVNFPMATHEARMFNERKDTAYRQPRELYEASLEEFRGRCLTFRLHIQFRQNSSWQGVVEWVPKKKKKRFRSELELLHLMVDAAEQGDALEDQY